MFDKVRTRLLSVWKYSGEILYFSKEIFLTMFSWLRKIHFDNFAFFLAILKNFCSISNITSRMKTSPRKKLFVKQFIWTRWMLFLQPCQTIADKIRDFAAQTTILLFLICILLKKTFSSKIFWDMLNAVLKTTSNKFHGRC